MTDQSKQGALPTGLLDGHEHSESKSTFFHPKTSPHIPETTSNHPATETMTQHSVADSKRNSFQMRQHHLNMIDDRDAAGSQVYNMNGPVRPDEPASVTYPSESPFGRQQLERSEGHGRARLMEQLASGGKLMENGVDDQRSYKSSAFQIDKNSTMGMSQIDRKSNQTCSERRQHGVDPFQRHAGAPHEEMQEAMEHVALKDNGSDRAIIQNYTNLRHLEKVNEPVPPANIHSEHPSESSGQQRLLRGPPEDSNLQAQQMSYQQPNALGQGLRVDIEYNEDGALPDRVVESACTLAHRRSQRSSLYVETDAKPKRGDSPDLVQEEPKSAGAFQSQYAQQWRFPPTQAAQPEPGKVQINFNRANQPVGQHGDEPMPSADSFSVMGSQRIQSEAHNSIVHQSITSPVNVPSHEPYVSHPVAQQPEMSPKQAERFAGSFGKQERGQYHKVQQNEQTTAGGEGIFSHEQKLRGYKSFESCGLASVETPNLPQATLGSTQEAKAVVRQLNGMGSGSLVDEVTANSRQTWQSVVVKNQNKNYRSQTFTDNRYSQMNVRMLRDQGGAAALQDEFAMKTMSQGSDGNVEVSSNFQKPLGISPMQEPRNSHFDKPSSPTFRSKSNDRTRRSSANLCQASVDKGADLIKRCQARRLGADGSETGQQVTQSIPFQRSMTSNNFSSSLNRAPYSRNYNTEMTRAHGTDQNADRRSAHSVNDYAANPYRRNQNGSTTFDYRQPARQSNGGIQFHNKLSNNVNTETSNERPAGSQQLLKTYKRLHGFKDEEPQLARQTGTNSSSVERYKAVYAPKTSGVNGVIKSQADNFDVRSPYIKSDNDHNNTYTSMERDGKNRSFLKNAQNAHTSPQIPNKIGVANSMAVNEPSAERYFNVHSSIASQQLSAAKREAAYQDSYARDLHKADASPSCKYELQNQSMNEDFRPQQAPYFSSSGAQLQYSQTNPKGLADLSRVSSIQRNNAQQNKLDVSMQDSNGNFAIERVGYTKDLDAELKACNDLISKIQAKYSMPNSHTASMTSPLTAAFVPPAPKINITQKATYVEQLPELVKQPVVSAYAPVHEPVTTSFPIALNNKERTVAHSTQPSRLSHLQNLNDPSADVISQNTQDIVLDHKTVSSYFEPKKDQIFEINKEETKLVPPINVAKTDRASMPPLTSTNTLPTDKGLVKQAYQSSPGQAPNNLDLESAYGPAKSSWFTQVYEELQTKKKQLNIQEKVMSNLKEENERLHALSEGMPDFIERLEALVNAQSFFKKSPKLQNSTPSTLMNKLEVFFCHQNMQEKKMERQLEEQDKVIDALKKIVLLEEKQTDYKQYLSSSRKDLKLTATVPSNDLYKDLMKKIEWVDELHDKVMAANEVQSDIGSSQAISNFKGRDQGKSKSDLDVTTQRSANRTVFFKEKVIQTDVDAVAFAKYYSEHSQQTHSPDLASMLQGELQRHLQENLKEISKIKLENGQLMEKCKHETKLNSKLKVEIRRLQRYEAFFEKQKMKKYRNCGCQIGSSQVHKAFAKDNTGSLANNTHSMVNSSTYMYGNGGEKKMSATAESITQVDPAMLGSLGIPTPHEPVADGVANKENSKRKTTPSKDTAPAPRPASRNILTSKAASDVSSIATPSNGMLKQHIKQTQELHNMLKSFLGRTERNKSGQYSARPEDEELLQKSKSILASIDASANRLSRGHHDQSQTSFHMKASEIQEKLEDMLGAEKTEPFIEAFDSRGSIRKSPKPSAKKKQMTDNTTSGLSNVQRKVTLKADKKKQSSLSPHNGIKHVNSGSRSNISLKKSCTTSDQINLVPQSESVKALDVVLKQQLIDKLQANREIINKSAINDVPPSILETSQTSKPKPPTMMKQKLTEPVLSRSTQRGNRWRVDGRQASKGSKGSQLTKDLSQKKIKRDISTSLSEGLNAHNPPGGCTTSKSCEKVQLKKKRAQQPMPATPDRVENTNNCDAYEHLFAAHRQLVQSQIGIKDDVSEQLKNIGQYATRPNEELSELQ